MTYARALFWRHQYRFRTERIELAILALGLVAIFAIVLTNIA